MKQGEFQSITTGEIRPVVIDSDVSQKELQDLKILLCTVEPQLRTVYSWNTKREHLKKSFSKEAMRALDASGFITDWLRGVNYES